MISKNNLLGVEKNLGMFDRHSARRIKGKIT